MRLPKETKVLINKFIESHQGVAMNNDRTFVDITTMCDEQVISLTTIYKGDTTDEVTAKLEQAEKYKKLFDFAHQLSRSFWKFYSFRYKLDAYKHCTNQVNVRITLEGSEKYIDLRLSEENSQPVNLQGTFHYPLSVDYADKEKSLDDGAILKPLNYSTRLKVARSIEVPYNAWLNTDHLANLLNSVFNYKG